MRLLIIPDIHGRDFWIEPCSHIDKFDKVVFLGDYHDPYSYQVSKDTSRHRLRDKLVPWIIEHKDKVICLIGNHDIEYLIGVHEGCRYDFMHAHEIQSYLKQMPLQLTYKCEGYLFSHSGILPGWMDLNEFNIDTLNNVPLKHPALMQVSEMRGGNARFGFSSCIWGDLYEYNASEHYTNYYQIFGHTQLHTEYISTDYACLDCREAFVLDTETKELKKI